MCYSDPPIDTLMSLAQDKHCDTDAAAQDDALHCCEANRHSVSTHSWARSLLTVSPRDSGSIGAADKDASKNSSEQYYLTHGCNTRMELLSILTEKTGSL